MIAATHNPSNLIINTLEFKVPHAKLKVEKLIDNTWHKADANIVCNNQEDE